MPYGTGTPHNCPHDRQRSGPGVSLACMRHTHQTHQTPGGRDNQAEGHQQAEKKHPPRSRTEQAPSTSHAACHNSAQAEHESILPEASNQVTLVIAAAVCYIQDFNDLPVLPS